MSDEEKKKNFYYYGGKEKKAGEIKKREEISPYSMPFQRDFDRMLERFQREFDDFWNMPARWRHGMRWKGGFPMMPFKGMMPSVDLEDRGKDFRLAVDLPGFSKEEVDIEITSDAVTIRAEKTQTQEEKKKNYVRRERMAQSFYRSIQLPAEVRSEEAKASLNNGTLEVILPKKEPKEIKRLPIT